FNSAGTCPAARLRFHIRPPSALIAQDHFHQQAVGIEALLAHQRGRVDRPDLQSVPHDHGVRPYGQRQEVASGLEVPKTMKPRRVTRSVFTLVTLEVQSKSRTG